MKAMSEVDAAIYLAFISRIAFVGDRKINGVDREPETLLFSTSSFISKQYDLLLIFRLIIYLIDLYIFI